MRLSATIFGHTRGFTLIEVVTSTLIIAAMAAGMFGAFVGARYIFRYSTHKMEAINFAREAQDKLRLHYAYDDPEMSLGSHLEAEIGTIIKGEVAGLPNVQLTYDVSLPEPDGYKKVTVRISWDERSFF